MAPIILDALISKVNSMKLQAFHSKKLRHTNYVSTEIMLVVT